MKDSVQFIVIIFLFFVSCQPVPKTVLISGTIENSTSEKVKLTNDVMDMELELVDGKFSAQFDIADPAFFNVRVGRESSSFFLSPGQNLDIYIDAKEFDESIKYTGEGSEASTYLAAKYLKNEKDAMPRADLYKMEESAFLEQLITNEKDGLAFLESHKTGLSDDFKKLEKVNIEFDQKDALLNYGPAHAYYAKVEGFKASQDLEKMIDDVNLNQSQNLASSSYGGFVTNYLSGKAYKMFLEDETYSTLGNDGILKASLDLIASKISDKEVRSYAADQIIKQTLSYSSALGIDPFLKDIKALTSTPKTFEIINKSLEEWGHLAKGEPAPDFDGMTLDGKAVKLSDMKGKNVYIDVWATWCGPCIREQPALFELEEKYNSNKNLAFMGVSIDSDKEAWTKMVSEKEMKGEQIFTEGAWKSDICSGYLIKGIPRFILVDKAGNIIDSDAPRPSSDQIKDILKNLSGEPLLSSL